MGLTDKSLFVRLVERSDGGVDGTYIALSYISTAMSQLIHFLPSNDTLFDTICALAIPYIKQIDKDISNGWVSSAGGGIAGIQLTASTFDVLKSGVLISHLPRTIQHAIYIMRQYKISYLWVESLCIIQDREAATIADVYQNCFLTITAAGATNSEQGLFAERDPLIYQPCWIYGNKDGENFWIHLN